MGEVWTSRTVLSVLLDLQISSSANDWERLLDCILTAEASGYSTAWTLDHFDGSLFGGQGMLECFTLCGAVAARTTTIGVGSMVANVANRHPALLAGAAASVQAISGGRFTLGIGSGSAPGTRWGSEHEALGIALAATPEERHARLLEQLDVIDELWSPDRRAELAGMALPDPRPPIIVGVNSTALARLAGRYADGVNVRLSHPRARHILDAAREAAGGKPFAVTAWTHWTRELTDPDSAGFREHAAYLDRLILSDLGPVSPAQFART
jgi:alkanesulfonate monooxygenase SsuD/methylene tetrahydromethanopterin reductase-like flavin-dependent oxidoreductase (luciferase family)